MKTSILLFLASFIFVTAAAQDLTGKWTATYMFGDVAFPSFINPVTLEFKLNPDSSYTVKSYSKIKNAAGEKEIAICNVSYNRKSKVRLVLEETELISSTIVERQCFQKFNLRIKEVGNSIVLFGQYSTKNCGSGGDIKFTRDP